MGSWQNAPRIVVLLATIVTVLAGRLVWEEFAIEASSDSLVLEGDDDWRRRLAVLRALSAPLQQ